MKPTKECTGSHNQAFWQMNFWKNDSTKGLSPKQVSTRTLEPQMAPSPVHTGLRQLQGEICWQETRTPSQTNPRRKLQSRTRMGQTMIHRHHLRLGLQVPASPFIHAWIHQKGSQTIQAQETQIATSTMPNAIIKYGAKTQYAATQSTSPQLNKHGKKFIQQVCGS